MYLHTIPAGLKTCKDIQSLNILEVVSSSLRGVLISSQQGPLIFLLRRKCSRLDVFVPKIWEKVAPLRSAGSAGNSACKNSIGNTRRWAVIQWRAANDSGEDAWMLHIYSQNIWLPDTGTDWTHLEFRRRSFSPLSAQKQKGFTNVLPGGKKGICARQSLSLTLDLNFMILNFSESSLNSW